MFKDNLIVCLKANGKILREVKDITYLPFGTEYTILIKNNESKRAQVKVWIDETDATDGTALVIEPNSSIELERFIKGGNLKEGNKLKFIEKTQKISDFRGDKIDDGFIRVEWQYELKYEEKHVTHVYHDWYYRGLYPNYPYYTLGGYCGSGVTLTNSGATPTFGAISNSSTFGGAATDYTLTSSMNNMSATASIATNCMDPGPGIATAFTAQAATARPMNEVQPRSLMNDAGITVPGGHSDQEFKQASWFALETTKHVITLKLLGESPEGKKVEAPVTVKTKPVCGTCGRQNKATAKFCGECGTGLQLF